MASANSRITGKMLCRLRMAKGFAQKEIAAKLQITQQAYSKLERNNVIKTAVLAAILIAMNSNMEELAIINFLQTPDN